VSRRIERESDAAHLFDGYKFHNCLTKLSDNHFGVQAFAVLQINPVMAQVRVQPSGCERWQAGASAERLPKYFVNVQ
jgi:hypothetical protein